MTDREAPGEAVTAHAETARRALEIACAGRDDAAIDEIYAESFVDHVNALEYRGTDGARRSVAAYAISFPTFASRSTNRSPKATASPAAGPGTAPTAAARCGCGGS